MKHFSEFFLHKMDRFLGCPKTRHNRDIIVYCITDTCTCGRHVGEELYNFTARDAFAQYFDRDLTKYEKYLCDMSVTDNPNNGVTPPFSKIDPSSTRMCCLVAMRSMMVQCPCVQKTISLTHCTTKYNILNIYRSDTHSADRVLTWHEY